MSETTPGREAIQIVEIQQPICSRVFGSSPCLATGTGDTKCYNTRATCQYVSAFDLATPLSLYFSKGKVADQGIAPYVIPSLVSVSTSPTRINLAGSNPDAQGLGNRALCTISFMDHAHTDRLVDPYLSGRSWDPLDGSRGSFWSRWAVRNKYRQNIVIKVYEGYAGQTLAEMTSRTYFMQSLQGPDSAGRVTIQGKDVLTRIEERKAQAPVASNGVLYTDLNSTDTSFEVAGALVSEYAASGTLRINDEIVTYTAVATSTNGIEFTGVTRGTDNTTAEEHSVDDTVQQCLRYVEADIDDVVAELLGDYGGIPSAYLDTTSWASEVDDYLTLTKINGLVTEPTSVFELMSELQEQCLFYVWWDERDAKVKLKAVRGIDIEPQIYTDESHIISGSFSLTEKPRERASQAWVYFNQTDYTASKTSPQAYAAVSIVANLESETENLYGEPSIRKVFARFLATSALATNTASKIVSRYVDVPAQCTFRMDAKDRAVWVGDNIYISHYLDVDAFGARRIRQWTITSAEEKVPGEVVEYTAEDTTLYGRINYIMASGAANYPGYDSAPFKNCYIGDADGLLSDGADSGKIS